MATWYYADGDAQKGPFAAMDIERLIATDTIGATTLVWQSGMAEWEAAGKHFAFGTATQPPLTQSTPASDPNIGPDGLYIGAPSREFVEAAKVCLSKYATFSGRASRSEFWFFYLFWNVAIVVAQMLDVAIILAVMALGAPFFLPVLTIIVMFGMVLPQLAVSWRRLHDIDRTGWWLGGGMIVTFVFYIAIVVAAIMAETADGFGNEPPDVFIALMGIFVLGMMAYGITIFIFYVSKGTRGPNRFG